MLACWTLSRIADMVHCELDGGTARPQLEPASARSTGVATPSTSMPGWDHHGSHISNR